MSSFSLLDCKLHDSGDSILFTAITQDLARRIFKEWLDTHTPHVNDS